MNALTLVILLAVLALAAGAGLYIWLSERSQALDRATAGLDLTLKHRQDVVTDLVETVRRADATVATEPLVAARNAAAMAATAGERAEAEAALDREIRRVLDRCQGSTPLSAAPGFAELRDEIGGIEAELAQARAGVATAADAYNGAVGGFPVRLAAGQMGFRRRPVA